MPADVDAVVAAFRAEGMKGSRVQMERFARAAVATCERDTVRLRRAIRNALRDLDVGDHIRVMNAKVTLRSVLAEFENGERDG